MTQPRRLLIVGNWKMNLGGAAGCTLAGQIAEKSKDWSPLIDLVVAPPFTAIAAVAAELDGSHVGVGAQNLYFKDSGAFTGEVSAPMLVEAGAKWVIVGHSERRHIFEETDPIVANKVKAAIAGGLEPIVCIGETLEERDHGSTLEVVMRQVDAVRSQLLAKPGFVVLAYEPVWAIGTGRNATPEQVEEVQLAIRQHLALFDKDCAEQTRILYGGSVKPDNATELLSCADVDGALVGGASLDAKTFLSIARSAYEVSSRANPN